MNKRMVFGIISAVEMFLWGSPVWADDNDPGCYTAEEHVADWDPGFKLTSPVPVEQALGFAKITGWPYEFGSFAVAENGEQVAIIPLTKGGCSISMGGTVNTDQEGKLGKSAEMVISKSGFDELLLQAGRGGDHGDPI